MTIVQWVTEINKENENKCNRNSAAGLSTQHDTSSIHYPSKNTSVPATNQHHNAYGTNSFRKSCITKGLRAPSIPFLNNLNTKISLKHFSIQFFPIFQTGINFCELPKLRLLAFYKE
jgi:hypothetical protein